MLRRSLLLVSLCLFSAAAAAAQTLDIDRTTFTIDGRTAVVALGVVNADKNTYSMPVHAELLDTNNVERASATVTTSIRPGEQTVTMRMELGELAETEGDELMWFRLRWSIGETQGIVSLMDIFHDNFSLRVSFAGWISPGKMYRTLVDAVDPRTDEPISGVSIHAVLKGENKDGDTFSIRADGVTAHDGSALIDLAIPEGISSDGDTELELIGTRNGLTIKANDDVSVLEPAWRFLIMTDKSLFQPGQTMHIRGILMRTLGGNVIGPGRELQLSIEDPEDNLLFRKKLVTSDFGVASVDWDIPDNAMLGGYKIIVHDTDQEDDDEIGWLATRVSRYDLPNFSVNVNTDKEYYLPSDSAAELTISADYVFGKPVPNGSVRIVEQLDRHWDWSKQSYDFKEGRTIEGKTDAEGKFSAKFDLAEFVKEVADDDTKDAAGFRARMADFDDIPLTAYFTDASTNRTEQRRFDLRLSREPIHIYVSDGNFDNIRELPSRLYIAAFYPDGTPAECGIEISVSEENLDEYIPLTHVQTNKYGLAVFELVRPNYKDKDADVVLHLKASDGNGNTVLYRDGVSYYDSEGLHIRPDRTIYRRGENIRAAIISTSETGRLIIRVFNEDRDLVNTSFADLVGGKASIEIPFEASYSGKVFITAYSPADNEGETVAVIYPKASGMSLTGTFDRTIYKPGEEGSLSFVVKNADGSPVESALGVSIFDKAVSLRTAADGGGSIVSSEFNSLLFSDGGFGTVTLTDIYQLDLSKAIPPDLDLVAERILNGAYIRFGSFSSWNYDSNPKQVFAKYFDEQMKPFKAAMDKQFKEMNFDHATDRVSFDRIARRHGLDLNDHLDPWDEKYYVKFGFANDKDTINIYSNGIDRKAETDDDIPTLSLAYTYFDRTGKMIDGAAERYHERTGKFIRDRETLLRELGVKEMPDRYGNPYLFDFSVFDSYYVITVTSTGKDGLPNAEGRRYDDFQVWRSSINYASDIQDSIRKILETTGEKPTTEEEFRSLLARNGMSIAEIRDGWDAPVYLNVRVGSRFIDLPKLVVTRKAGEQETNTITRFTPVTQDYVRFDIRSGGKDGKLGTRDDFTLTSNVVTIRAVSKDEQVVERFDLSAEAGSIFLTTVDSQGALVPGVTVTIRGDDLLRKFTTDQSGNLWIRGLKPGTYSVTTDPEGGFAASEVTGVLVENDKATLMRVVMYAVEATVEVTVSGDSMGMTVDSTDSKSVAGEVIDLPITTLKQKKPNLAGGFTGFTPRLREYFPETLLWRPDLVTDKDGKITANFKMADNITTWKMYAIASDRSGRVALTEGETSAFRPFFIDLDPPRYLTKGDVISLPVQIRNYTEAKQAADVSMAKGDWFSISGGGRKRLSIPAGSSENAVFKFTVERMTKDGKQRVTAIANGESDAVEKPVTVSPNGRKIVDSESAVFSGTRRFEIDVPGDAIKDTATAEIKIYPNLLAHIVEAQTGLLRRPVGCGEQTISTSYPNLMMLRFPNADADLKQRALKNLQAGYERLLGYRSADGGFTYWGGTSKPSVELTAYALRFLIDAKEFIAVDADVINDAEKWLLKRARADGWHHEYEVGNSSNTTANRTLTTYIVRTLAMLKPEPNSDAAKNLEFGLELVRGYSEQFEDPYRLALYGLAAADSGHSHEADNAAERLVELVHSEGAGEYWNLETNTVFYGWGKPARIETTALAIQLLSRVGREKYADHISRGLVFLLNNKDIYGVWYSTQTTVNVLDSFVQLLRGAETNSKTPLRISVNGDPVKEMVLEPDAIEQQTIDISAFLHPGKNSVEIAADESSSIMAQTIAEHYVKWDKTKVSPVDITGNRAVMLRYDCGSGNAAIMETITCTASVERVGFKGYGMLIAELGVPPGADIDRKTLDDAMTKNGSISRYEVLPDRIIIYLYAKPGGTTFTFSFRPRYGIDALAPASSAYDYYNPLARAEVEPMKFVVR